MKIRICVPSYGRPNRVETLDYLPNAYVYVAESQYKNYRKYYSMSNIVGVQDKYQGNLCRIRNKILDDNKNVDVVCIVDDDLQGISYWEEREKYDLDTEEDVMAFIMKYSIMAYDLGVKLWGVNVNQDKQVYREYSPFSFISYIGGPFMCHLKTDLRFDERLPLKEDYDFTLQNLNRYRKVLRVNKYFYRVRQVEQAGGCAFYRNMEEKKRQMILLQKKWGSHIVRKDYNPRSHNLKKKKRLLDINPVIYPPIKGI